MAYPLKASLKPRGPLCQISLDDLNTIANMLNGLQIELIDGDNKPEVRSPDQNGRGWTVRIPSGSGGGSDEITVVTDVRFDASTLQLQKKTRLVKVTFVEDEDESDWTLMEGGQMEDCP